MTDLLRLHKQLEVAQVASMLGVSDATVRRLFGRLEKEQIAIRTHGGIRLVPEMHRKYDLSESQIERVAEKVAIGLKVSQLVNSGDVVFLDSGSTVAKLAESLLGRLESNTLTDLTILTNSLNVVDTLADSTKVLLVGGEARGTRRDVCGPVAEKNLGMFRVRLAFFGTDGIDLDSGFMTTDERTAMMNQVILHRAARSCVLADHSKFRRASFVSYAELDEISDVFTDDGLSSDEEKQFRKYGANIHRVSLGVEHPPARGNP